ncbi:hypothetical protein TNCT_483171 [Trichonephila clavata]|uniref:Uncharacterized protein n=1 Tax=Trichonephila clavata TaxID=2740835 RepID=A0A8X6IIU3_TRICU|nr:hypothetical protein TNCT_483171 [Trichonephila clavata]
MDVHKPEYDLKMVLIFTFTKTPPAFASFIAKLISKMSMLTLIQSVKLLMLQNMTIPPALRHDNDDTVTDDVVEI